MKHSQNICRTTIPQNIGKLIFQSDFKEIQGTEWLNIIKIIPSKFSNELNMSLTEITVGVL